MQGNRGKMCAQAGHAFLHSYWDNMDRFSEFNLKDDPDVIDHAMRVRQDYEFGDDARKITLITPTTDDLRRLVEKYRPITGVTLVEDCGYTVVEPGTITCAGIGPLRDEDKDDELRSLRIFT
jgi:peptidyl-tRNA hydrolase